MTRDAQAPRRRRRDRVARGLWVTLGGIALALGLIGIALPVMPTTPFILVAAFAFSRGSKTLSTWIDNHAHFGPVIADWRQNGAIAPRHKRLAVAMMAASMGFALFLDLPPMVLAIQAICLSGAALFVWTRPDGKA